MSSIGIYWMVRIKLGLLHLSENLLLKWVIFLDNILLKHVSNLIWFVNVIIWYSSPGSSKYSTYFQDIYLPDIIFKLHIYLPDIIGSHLTDVQHCKERGDYGFVYLQYVFCGLPHVTTWLHSSNVKIDNV